MLFIRHVSSGGSGAGGGSPTFPDMSDSVVLQIDTRKKAEDCPTVVQQVDTRKKAEDCPTQDLHFTWRHFVERTWVHLVVAFGIFALGLGVAVFLAGTAQILIVLEWFDVVHLLLLSFLEFTRVL